MGSFKDMKTVSNLVKDVYIPKMVKVKQTFDKEEREFRELQIGMINQLNNNKIKNKIKKDMDIAIAVGSRGINNLISIVKSTVEFIKLCGGKPFIVPSMGSHGGASSENQKAILESLGITEKKVGCPVTSCMEVKCIGKNEEGKEILIDKHAAESDGIIPICRVKPHTAFRGKYESGIMKMLAIGLSKQAGAERTHGDGVGNLAKNIYLFGKAILKNAPVMFAVAIVENAYDETSVIEIVDADAVEDREPELLKIAFKNMPRIWVDECDLLIVDFIGKNYSGDGMDPNITGTFCTPYATGGISSQKVAVLDISKESHGNGAGIGFCDTIPVRLYDKLDLEALYVNSITSTVLACARVPMIMKNHKECIQVCLRSCVGINKKRPKIVRIPNTLYLEHIMLSEAYIDDIKNNKHLEIEGSTDYLNFNEEGNLF